MLSHDGLNLYSQQILVVRQLRTDSVLLATRCCRS